MAVYTREQVNDLLRKAQGDQSLRSFARQLNVSAPYLSDIFHCNRHPGPVILEFLRLRCEKKVLITYIRGGKS